MRLTIFGKTFSVGEAPEPTTSAERKEPSVKSLEDFGIQIAGRNFAGQNVTVSKSLELDTVYACIRDKSESCGQLPFKMYNAKGEEIKSGRKHRIFCKRPNEFMTQGELTELIITCLESYGRFFAYVIRNKYGNISEIIPFRNQVNVGVNMDTNGRVYYTYSTNDGKPGMAFAGREIMHLKLNTLDGFTGMSPIRQAANTLGLAMAQEEHLSSLMKNGARPTGALETDHIFQDESKGQRVLDQWNNTYAGSSNSGKTAMLENGLKYKPITISPADTELVKQRIFSRVQICAIFRVPPHRVGVLEAKAYDRLEDNNRAYMRDVLVPLLKKIEDWYNEQLGDSELSLRYDTREFTRGDRLSQVEAVGQEIKMGLVSINEGRVDLGRHAVEGGDVHAIDTNNLTFGRLEDIPKLQEEQRLANQPQPQQVEEEENAE